VDGKRFPARIFLLYFLFYSGQSIYNTYLNLYLTKQGFTKTMIGSVLSISTAFLLLAQLFWGVASDRTKSKNTIIKVLFAGCAAVALLFYVSSDYLYLLFIITLFSIFFSPVIPLNDNLTLELLEDTEWDFGQIRMGGTIGYAVTVFAVGFILKDEYSPIFWMTSLMMILCFITVLGLPNIKRDKTKKGKAPFMEIFKNKTMIGLVVFNIVSSFGTNIYQSYYPIYFTSIGGTSSQIGTMMFVSALSEIPFFLGARRTVQKFGVEKIIISTGIVTGIRWLLLYFVSNPTLIIVTSLLHGVSFAGSNYCMTTFINKTVPSDLRATSHSVFAFIGTFFSRIVFGYLGGLAGDLFGINNMMLVSSIVSFVGVILFLALSKNAFLRPCLWNQLKDFISQHHIKNIMI